MSESGIVVVGGGLAGAKAVEAVRLAGYAESVTLLAEEDELPYERPPLSKGLLAGKSTDEDARVLPADWYADHDVTLRLGVAATGLDLDEAEVELSDGSRLEFDRLLLATGSAPRRLDVPGAADADLLYLRTLPEARRLKSALDRAATSVVVVGGGWIGLEVAAAARAAGHDVTVIEPLRTPLFGALGAELGEHFAALHRDHGVDVRTGTAVDAIESSGDGAVVVAGEQRFAADLVVVGVGIAPRTDLAEAAGLDVATGVLTDASLRTSHPLVFAAGDVAESFNPTLGRHLRVDHWANALNGGSAAGQAMAGLPVAYDRIPYFFSDQYDLGMEFSGVAAPGSYDRVVHRGDPASGEFVAFWLDGGRVVAGMNVNVWDVVGEIQGLIRSRREVPVEMLTDPGVPLAEL